jgi:hypothetical protein
MNMSHIVSIETEIRDASAIRAACDRLRLPEPVFGAAKLFSGSKTGWTVNLPAWRFPVVCDVATGKVDFDNFGGRWGEQKESVWQDYTDWMVEHGILASPIPAADAFTNRFLP